MCLSINANHYDALCLKGALLFSLDKPKEALNIYSKAIKIDINNSKAYIEKALVYKNIGNYTSALKLAKKAYEINPKDEFCKCQYIILRNLCNFY